MQLRFEGSTALLNEVIDYLECFLFLIPLFWAHNSTEFRVPTVELATSEKTWKKWFIPFFRFLSTLIFFQLLSSKKKISGEI